MNIKFKMPKFQRHLTNKAMWKELLLTFLGTTISIVLTFGTAHLLDVRQRVKDRKMSALMVTGNVERFARVLDDLADELKPRQCQGTLVVPVSNYFTEEFFESKNITFTSIKK